MPAVNSVGSALETIFGFKIFFGVKRFRPVIVELSEIVGMQQHFPVAPFGFIEGCAGVIEPALIIVIEPSVGLGCPHDLRHGVGERVILLFAGQARFLDLNAVFNSCFQRGICDCSVHYGRMRSTPFKQQRN